MHQHINSTNIFVENHNTNYFSNDFIDSQVYNINSEIDSEFLSRKNYSIMLSSVYEILEFYSRSARVQSCGSWLEFGIFPDKTVYCLLTFAKTVFVLCVIGVVL